jgi:hypothetical protein
MEDFANVTDLLLGKGQLYQIQIDYDACEGPGSSSGQIYGGISWQPFVSSDPSGANLYSTQYAAIKQNITGVPGLAWNAASVQLNADNSAEIDYRIYDWFTGANLATVHDLTVCQLGTGVTFFKYP